VQVYILLLALPESVTVLLLKIPFPPSEWPLSPILLLPYPSACELAPRA